MDEFNKNNHNPIDVGKDTSGWWSEFYCCPYCGTEVMGSKSYFNRQANPVCPLCREPVVFDDFHYINLAPLNGMKQRVAPQRKDGVLHYNVEDGSLKVFSQAEIPDNEKEKWQFLRVVHDYDEYFMMPRIFDYLALKRKCSHKSEWEKKLKQLLENCDIEGNYITEKPNGSIKGNAEALKEYIKHLIVIESSLYAIKKRLLELYELQTENDSSFKQDNYRAAIVLRENVEKARSNIADARRHVQLKSVNMPRSRYVPEKPVSPYKPTLKEAGLFNRKKVEAENAQLMKRYEEEVKQYEQKLKEYEEKTLEYEAEYKRQSAIVDEENKEIIRKAEEENRKQLSEAEDALDRIEKHPESIISAESIKRNMVNEEIQEAEQTLRETIRARNELYSYNVVFEKYRNLLALSSFYEYLMSGRCDTLEGANGAYNIYEGEIRSNQIISQLSDVVASLETIKNNQYMAYSQLSAMNSGLSRLNSKMNAAVDSLGIINDTVIKASENSAQYLKAIAESSEMTAYNTERTAYYTKKNVELTNALGYVVALK